jgi:hypothetical protein
MSCTFLMEAWRRPAAMKRESSLVGGVSRVGVTVKKFRWGKEKEENKERGCSPVYFRFFSWNERRRDKDTRKANKGDRIERSHG